MDCISNRWHFHDFHILFVCCRIMWLSPVHLSVSQSHRTHSSTGQNTTCSEWEQLFLYTFSCFFISMDSDRTMRILSSLLLWLSCRQAQKRKKIGSGRPLLWDALGELHHLAANALNKCKNVLRPMKPIHFWWIGWDGPGSPLSLSFYSRYLFVCLTVATISLRSSSLVGLNR